MPGTELELPGGELVVPDSPASLLDLMRRIAHVFQANYDAFHSMLAFASGASTAGMNPSPYVQMCQRLKTNADLVLNLPGFLGAGGMAMLTAQEREALLMWAGYAHRGLANEEPDGSFRSTYILQILCRQEDVEGTLFDHIVARLEGELRDELQIQRHIEALDELLAQMARVDANEGRVMARFEQEGVTFQPAVGVSHWQRPSAMKAAITLVILGIPLNVGDKTVSGGEFLYGLGFRARV